MKWLIKDEEVIPYGTTRYKKRFLLFPKTIWNDNKGGHELRWLEVATWEEKRIVAFAEDYTHGFWQATVWVD